MRQRAKSMSNHPSRYTSLDRWEKQFREMDKDAQAVQLSNSRNTNTDGY